MTEKKIINICKWNLACLKMFQSNIWCVIFMERERAGTITDKKLIDSHKMMILFVIGHVHMKIRLLLFFRTVHRMCRSFSIISPVHRQLSHFQFTFWKDDAASGCEECSHVKLTEHYSVLMSYHVTEKEKEIKTLDWKQWINKMQRM